MKRHFYSIALLFMATCCLSLTVQAAPILQDSGGTTIQVNYYEPVGQSFIAQDSTISFAFYYSCINCWFDNSDDLRISLLEGDGLEGNVLSTFDFNLADDFVGFHDIDFSEVSLDIGSSYTAMLEVSGTSPFWGIRIHQGSDAYGDGQYYESIENRWYDSPDAMFRVTPIATVSEPLSIALLMIGFLGISFSRNRQTKG